MTTLPHVTSDDILEFGLIPELVGRLPVHSALTPLDQDDLVRVLTEPKNALIKQYTQLLNYDKVTLRVSEDALSAIAQEAIKRETGARGLRAILEHLMLDIMYEIPSSSKAIEECVITADSILKNEPPVLVYEDERKALSA